MDLNVSDLAFKVDELEVDLSEARKLVVKKDDHIVKLENELRLIHSREDELLLNSEDRREALEQSNEQLREKIKLLQKSLDDYRQECETLNNETNRNLDQLRAFQEFKDANNLLEEQLASLTQIVSNSQTLMAEKDSQIEDLTRNYNELRESYEQFKEYHKKEENSFNYSFCDGSFNASSASLVIGRQSFTKCESLADSLLPVITEEKRVLEEELNNVRASFDKAFEQRNQLEHQLSLTTKERDDLQDLKQRNHAEILALQSDNSQKSLALENAESTVAALNNSLQQLNSDLDSMNTSNALLESEIAENSAKLDTLSSQLVQSQLEHKNRVAQLENALDGLKQENAAFKSQISVLESSRRDLETTLQDKISTIEQINSEVEFMKKQLNDFEDRETKNLQEFQQKIVTLESENSEYHQRACSLEAQLENNRIEYEKNIAEKTVFCENMERTVDELHSSNTSQESRIGQLQSEGDSLRNQINVLEQRETMNIQEFQEKTASMEEASSKYRQQIASLDAQLEQNRVEHQKNIEEKEELLKNFELTVEELRSLNSSQETRIDQLQSEGNLLQNQIDALVDREAQNIRVFQEKTAAMEEEAAEYRQQTLAQLEQNRVEHQKNIQEKEELIKNMELTVEELRSTNTSYESRIDILQAESEAMKKQYEDDLVEKLKNLEQKENEASTMRGTIQDLQSSNQALEHQVEQLKSEGNQFREQMLILETREEASLLAYQAKTAKMEEEVSKHLQQLALLESQLEKSRTEHEKNLEEKHQLLVNAESTIEELRSSNNTLESQIHHLQSEVSQVAQERTQIEEKLTEKENVILKMQIVVDESQSSKSALEAQLQELQSEIEHHVDANQKLQVLNQESQEEATSKSNEICQLTSQVDSLKTQVLELIEKQSCDAVEFDEKLTQEKALCSSLNSEIETLKTNLARSNADAETISAQLKASNAALSKMELEKNYLAHDIEDFKFQLQQKDVQIEKMTVVQSANVESFKSDNYALQFKIESLEMEIAKLSEEKTEQSASSSKKIADLELFSRNLQGRLDSLQDMFINTEKDLKEKEDECDKFKEESAELKKNQEILVAKVDKYRDVAKRFGDKIAEQNEEIDKLEQELNKFSASNVNPKYSKLKEEYDAMEKDYKFLKINFEINQKNKERLLRDVQLQDKKINELQSQVKRVMAQNEQRQQQQPTFVPPLPVKPRSIKAQSGSSIADSEPGCVDKAASCLVTPPPPLPPKRHYTEAPAFPTRLDHHRDDASCVSEESFRTFSSGSSLHSQISQDFAPKLQINSHFAMADEEGQFMEGSLINIDETRKHQLMRRNTMVPPHLRSSYALEIHTHGLSPHVRRQTLAESNINDCHKRSYSQISSLQDDPTLPKCPSSPKLVQRKQPRMRFQKLTPSKILCKTFEQKSRTPGKENQKDK